MTKKAFRAKLEALKAEWCRAPKGSRYLNYDEAVSTVRPGDITQVMWLLERRGVCVSARAAFCMAYHRRCVLDFKDPVDTAGCVTRKGDKAGAGQARD